jgi:hypothetical protein
MMLTHELLKAYIDGDGYCYRGDGYWRASTVSEELAQNMATLANKLGCAANINIGTPLSPRRLVNNPRISYNLRPPIDILIRLQQKRRIKTSFADGFQESLIKRIVKAEYNGPVYNLEVAEDNSFVTAQGAVHNCYHEHLSYLSLGAVKVLLANSSLRIHRTIHYPIHGGALLVMLRHKDSAKLQTPDYPVDERVGVQEWTAFAQHAKAQRAALSSLVGQLRTNGYTVAALGASAKSTVWINACGFTEQEIKFIADCTPEKQGCFSPGTNIPVFDEDAVLRELPDYLVCFAWNYRPEILDKFTAAREKGVKFIFPVPKLEIV